MPRKFPREFRDDVVRVARQNEQSLVEVARSFGVSSTTVQRWVAQAEIDDGDRRGVSSSEKVTVAELKKRNRLLAQENEILRRAAAFFAKDISPK